MKTANTISEKKLIQVSTAVIYYQEDYLLGYRHQHQHQGDKYEFVGGKIEANETPTQALIREVQEEIGINLVATQCIEMGIIKHDYTEMAVELNIFSVQLDDEQFKCLQNKAVGELNQPLKWVSKPDLLANKYPLPDANHEILTWLANPD